MRVHDPSTFYVDDPIAIMLCRHLMVHHRIHWIPEVGANLDENTSWKSGYKHISTYTSLVESVDDIRDQILRSTRKCYFFVRPTLGLNTITIRLIYKW